MSDTTVGDFVIGKYKVVGRTAAKVEHVEDGVRTGISVETTDLWLCSYCGAVVGDTDRHTRYHWAHLPGL